jgi:DNA uptake protein ComE-like DNA-binding protein
MMAGAMLLAGCVTNSQYQEALMEADNAREELEKVRQQKTAMEQQVRTLKELNVKFSNEALAARDELQRIEHGRDKERGSVDGRTKDLEEQLKALSAQNRNVRQEYQDVKRHNETLKSLVARYQKELKDRSHSTSAVIVPPAADTKAQAPAAPSAGPSAAMNINRVSASDLVLFLGLKQEEADRIVSNRPYRVKGELVAKNVVPKETFDLIKDRISVSQ